MSGRFTVYTFPLSKMLEKKKVKEPSAWEVNMDPLDLKSDMLIKFKLAGTSNYQSSNYQVFTVKNFVLASSDFCHLLITFANSLDPDQDRQNVCPGLDPNHLIL